MELMTDRRSVPSPCLPDSMTPSCGCLVLLGCGKAEQIALVQQQAAPALASGLGLGLAAPLPACSDGLAAMAAPLASLQDGTLTPLPLDPGQIQADGSHWAEALGAWRQPCLLLLTADQLDGGLPAAATALLQHWHVPLLGLVQWGGPWQAPLRRHDRLPWLGELTGDPEALAATAGQRWPVLAAELR